MTSPDNRESPNSSETYGGKVPLSPPRDARTLGRTALGASPSPSTRRALGAAALGGSASRDPDALDRAANQLEAVVLRLGQIASATQTYQGKVDPIAQGVVAEVGGSATGMDKQIAGALQEFARAVGRSAQASHHAAGIANRLAAQARAEAQRIRREQEAERRSRQQPRGR